MIKKASDALQGKWEKLKANRSDIAKKMAVAWLFLPELFEGEIYTPSQSNPGQELMGVT